MPKTEHDWTKKTMMHQPSVTNMTLSAFAHKCEYIISVNAFA